MLGYSAASNRRTVAGGITRDFERTDVTVRNIRLAQAQELKLIKVSGTGSGAFHNP